MKKKTMALMIGFALVGFFLTLLPAYSQEDMTVLADSAFKNRQRPPAVFMHDEHNEKAQIDDCAVCHHVYRDGVKVEDESNEGTPCSDCHNVNEGYPTLPLMKAYHQRCEGCHQQEGSGPITCGECHKRGGAPAHTEEGASGH